MPNGDYMISPEEFKLALDRLIKDTEDISSARGTCATCQLIKSKLEEDISDAEKVEECIMICDILLSEKMKELNITE